MKRAEEGGVIRRPTSLRCSGGAKHSRKGEVGGEARAGCRKAAGQRAVAQHSQKSREGRERHAAMRKDAAAMKQAGGQAAGGGPPWALRHRTGGASGTSVCSRGVKSRGAAARCCAAHDNNRCTGKTWENGPGRAANAGAAGALMEPQDLEGGLKGPRGVGLRWAWPGEAEGIAGRRARRGEPGPRGAPS